MRGGWSVAPKTGDEDVAIESCELGVIRGGSSHCPESPSCRLSMLRDLKHGAHGFWMKHERYGTTKRAEQLARLALIQVGQLAGTKGTEGLNMLFAAFCCITNRRTSYLHLLGNSVALIGSFHSHTHTHADFVRSFPGEVKSADRLTRSTDCSAACGNRTKATAPTCFRVYTGSCCTLNVLNQSSVRTTK